MTYRVLLASRAESQLDGIPFHEYLRLDAAIVSLGQNPRPHNCRKMKTSDSWRVRVGNYRIVYAIDDTLRTVLVLNIGHRREIYR